MTSRAIALRPLGREDLVVVEPWFADGMTRRFLGGPDWPARMLELSDRVVGQAWRGAVQTGACRYLAEIERHPVGYIDCGTFDRCVVYGGEGPDGPIITESLDVAVGSIAFVVAPALRRRGVGRAMIPALLEQPELGSVELFEAGVEPENVASRRCLDAAGFRARWSQPDFEGILYYRTWRSRGAAPSFGG